MTLDDRHNRLDELTRARLARLASLPVDTTGVASRLRAQIHGQRAAGGTFAFALWSSWLGRAAVAAVIVLGGATLLFLASHSGSPVYAGPEDMVKLHRDLVAGRAPIIAVADIAEARRVIDGQWRDAPPLPDFADQHVHACCLRGVKSRKVACVMLDQDKTPVTVVVARLEDFRLPEEKSQVRHGQPYVATSHDGVNMVMTQRNDRWMCLMSELPLEQVMALADRIDGAASER
jgi:hypothetical protein